MKLRVWGGSAAAVDQQEEIVPRQVERRGEPRYPCCGLKVIIRERRALGIIHLKDLSRWGAGGITDLAVDVGTLVFLELKRGHFYAARVKWVKRLAMGLQFARPMQDETLERLLGRARQDA